MSSGTFAPRSALRLGSLLLLLALAARLPALGAPVLSLKGFAVTNETGLIVAADAANAAAGYDRDELHAGAVFEADNTGGVATNFWLATRLTLEDATGNPLSFVEGGATVSELLSSNVFNLPANRVQRYPFLRKLAPAVPLDAARNHRLRLRYVSSLAATPTEAIYGPTNWLHFPDPTPTAGDFNLAAVVGPPAWVVTSATGFRENRPNFSADVPWWLWRYDQPGVAPQVTPVPAFFQVALLDPVGGTNVPLKRSFFALTPSLPTHVAGAVTTPANTAGTNRISFEPTTDLVPDRNYRLAVTIGFTNSTGPGVPSVRLGNTALSPASTLAGFHFNGRLYFGNIRTSVGTLGGLPTEVVAVALPGAPPPDWLLRVVDQSGTVDGVAGPTFGGGETLRVTRRANGDAVFSAVPHQIGAGPVLNVAQVTLLPNPNSAAGTTAGVKWNREGAITLDEQGAHAERTRVDLPAGFGWREDLSSRILHGSLTFRHAPLGQLLLPEGPHVRSEPLTAVVDAHPLGFICSGLVWQPGEGTFVLTTPLPFHVAFGEYALPDGATKKSNTKVYQFVNPLRPSLLAKVETSPDGVARFTGDVEFTPTGNFTAHFPYGADIHWTNGGHLELVGDRPVVAGDLSRLNGVVTVGAPYSRNCPDCEAAGVPDTTPLIAPLNSRLNFTLDGGLAARGTNITLSPLNWGYVAVSNDFAHGTLPFASGNFHLTGHHLRGGETGLDGDFGGAVLALTGVDATAVARVERPDLVGTTNSLDYLAGARDYAGLNYRADGALPAFGSDLIAGDPIRFRLEDRAKYYVRAAGVSGIHEAEETATFSGLSLYGYPSRLDTYSLAFLDSQNTDSRTDGEIAVPAPARFLQGLDNLRFTCTGGLETAEPPANDPEKRLEFWRANFTTLGITFAQPASCDSTEGYLVLGVQAHAAPLDQPLTGQLGFLPDGNLISAAEGAALGIPEVTSRLKVPTGATFAGPVGDAYRFTPVADAYLNDARSAGAEPVGWMNLAGTLDVSFFEDMQVHVHAAADQHATNAPFFFMGGWPGDNGGDNFGWRIGGDDYFTPGVLFDPLHVGHPATTGATAYRNGDTEDFNPRVYQSLFGLLPLQYELKWNPATREFASRESKTLDLFVLNTYNAVTRLTPSHTHLRFGAEYEGLPQVDLDQIFQPLGQIEADLAEAIADAITETARDQINQGLAELDRLLADQFAEVTEPIFTDVLDPAISDLYAALSSAYGTATNWPVTMRNTVSNHVHNVIRPRLKDLVFTTAGAQRLNLAQQLDGSLRKIEAGIGGVEQLLAVTGGQRSAAAALTTALIGSLSPEYAGSYTAATRDALLADRDPTYATLLATLQDVHGTATSIRSSLGSGAGLDRELDAVFQAGAAEFEALANGATDAIADWFDGLNGSLGSPFAQYTEQEIKDRLRAEVTDRFYALNTTAVLQGVLREWLQDFNAAFRQALASLFEQVNGVIHDLLNPVIGAVEREFNGFLDDLDGPLKHASLTGFADIYDDKIDYLRLDATVQMDVSGPLEVGAFLEIKALDSTGAGAGCYGPGDTATEVSLGVNNLGIAWVAPDLRANVVATFALKNNRPAGLGGSVEILGDFNLETLKVTDFFASAAFGAEDNYISGTVGLEFNGNALQGGAFFGRTCSLDPLRAWAPTVADVIGTPPFTGAYGYGEASFPLTQLLGIPPSCVLDVTIGAGVGAGFFLQGPTYVGTIYGGVTGRVLCLAEVSGDVTLSGAKAGSDYNFSGVGLLYGKFGVCPICIKGHKELTLKYANGDWDYSFSPTKEDR